MCIAIIFEEYIYGIIDSMGEQSIFFNQTVLYCNAFEGFADSRNTVLQISKSVANT